jgi:anti-sigma-K factor RskA
MTGRDDLDATAAEYVLGTLDAGERAAVSARRRREPDLDAAIEAWERRLGPLVETMAPAAPSPGLYSRIEARIAAHISAGAGAQHIVALERRATRWRQAAIAATALAASLLVLVVAREFSRPDMAQTYVAVFQKDDASPAFLLTVDLETRTLSVRPVAAEPQPGKSYQLWIAADKLGPAPRSLGLIDAQGVTTHTALAQYDRAILEKATFGVSLEPAGGSPTGKPTGPAFHAKLIPTAR